MLTRVWVESSRPKEELEKFVVGAGFRLDEKEPEMVITYGGDGSILHAETKYPGIPKLPIRESRISARCETYSLDQLPKILHKLGEGRFKTYELAKVEAYFKGRSLIGLNEVQIHAKVPTHSIRFSFEMNKHKVGEVIGDGIIAATPLGSTAYFRSAGGKPFRKGIKLLFNNTWPRHKPADLVSVAVIRILRNRAWLAADNNEDMIELKPEDSVEIRKCESRAIFVKI